MITNMHPTVPETNPGTISLLLGDGRGQFGSAPEFAVGRQPVALTTGDFNNDDHLDIATANRLSGDVSILLGDGRGDFQTVGPVAVEPEPRSITGGDFNKDGHADIATANFAGLEGPGTVSILLGDGSGGFIVADPIEVGHSPNTIIAGDFNHDDHLDLAVSGNPITLLLGNGDGSFGVRKLPWSSLQITAGDFDNDGNLDIAASEGFVLLGDGSGGFAIGKLAVESSLRGIATRA